MAKEVRANRTYREEAPEILETYVGWTCDLACSYCSAWDKMRDARGKKVTREGMAATLVKYRAQGYRAVTFLGGEPLLQPVFPFSAKLARKLGMTVCISTNGSLLQDAARCAALLVDVDDLVISVPAVSAAAQTAITRSRAVDYVRVLSNVRAHWKGRMLKLNVVLQKGNLGQLEAIADLAAAHGVPEIAFTYPDLPALADSPERMAQVPAYSEAGAAVAKAAARCEKLGVRPHAADLPICFLPPQWRRISDDGTYANRTKIETDGRAVRRDEVSPRWRKHAPACAGCAGRGACWGPTVELPKFPGLGAPRPF